MKFKIHQSSKLRVLENFDLNFNERRYKTYNSRYEWWNEQIIRTKPFQELFWESAKSVEYEPIIVDLFTEFSNIIIQNFPVGVNKIYIFLGNSI